MKLQNLVPNSARRVTATLRMVDTLRYLASPSLDVLEVMPVKKKTWLKTLCSCSKQPTKRKT